MLVVGYLAIKLNSWLTDVGTRDPSVSWTIAAVTCLPVAGVVAFKTWRSGDLWLPGRLVPFAVILYFGVFYGAYDGARQHEHGVIADYCKYGAVSQAQLDGCRRHVSEQRIDSLDTSAARFARRDLEDCLADSGPYCLDALNWRLQMDQAPPPGQ